MSLPASQLLATNWGSPAGVTTTSHLVTRLWAISYYFAIPIGAIVIGGIIWCIVRYRHKPGDTRMPKQFQYHIPIEAAYTIIPLVVCAIIFGFMYGVDNKIDNLSKHPAVKITVEGFQWGWRFDYPNGYQEVGSIASEPSINDSSALPILRMPEHETVQFTLRSDDVNHSFYVPEFLFKRDLIQGINNVVDINVTSNGDKTFIGECTQLCGTYHAYMRFEVMVMPPAQFNSWMGSVAHTIHYAGSNS